MNFVSSRCLKRFSTDVLLMFFRFFLIVECFMTVVFIVFSDALKFKNDSI